MENAQRVIKVPKCVVEGGISFLHDVRKRVARLLLLDLLEARDLLFSSLRLRHSLPPRLLLSELSQDGIVHEEHNVFGEIVRLILSCCLAVGLARIHAFQDA